MNRIRKNTPRIYTLLMCFSRRPDVRWCLVPALALLCAGVAQAQDTSDEGGAPLSEAARAAADEETLQLEDLEVVSEGFAFEQEFTLRLLRESLDKPRSRKQEDRDDWVCWIDEATGSHFNYLNCARNGDLWALERPNGLDAPTVPMGGYGTILRSDRPVNRSKLKRAMASLAGPEGFDREFLALVATGERPPRDIPDEEELDAFAEAYERVGRLQSRGASEERQIEAIRETGLGLTRYNRIAELTQVYQTLENSVAERLGR